MRLNTLLLAGLLSSVLGGATYAEAIVNIDAVTSFQSPTPATGWSYLWNSGGALGTAANYVDYVWNAGVGRYFGVATGSPAPGSNYASITKVTESGTDTLRVVPGPAGSQFPAGSPWTWNIYSIVAYEIQEGQAGFGQITNSNLTSILGGGSQGVDIAVYVNDALKQHINVGGGQSSNFDCDLGQLAVGDKVYVALGPGLTTSEYDLAYLAYQINLWLTNSFNGNGGTTDYNTASNWGLGTVPTADHSADISNGLSATLNTAVTGQPHALSVGSGGNAGHLDIQAGGELTVNGAIVVGQDGSSSADLSTLTISGGTLNQTGTAQAMIGGNSGAPGKLIITGGALNITTSRTTTGDGEPVLGIGGIHAAGTGSVEQSGGVVNIQSNSTETRLNGLGIGTYAGSTGSYTMSGGELNVGTFSDNGIDGDTEMNMFVGYRGQGTFTQTGGVVNVSRKLTIGMQAGVSSVYDMSTGNGVLNHTTYGELIVSNGGTDSLLVGGESTVNTYGFRLGRGNGNGTITMTGGTINVVGATGIYTSGTGTLNLGGGVLDMHGNHIKSLTNFNFTGGELRNANVDFSVTQTGGVFSPGYTTTWNTEDGTSSTSIGNTITGDYTLTSGSLAFDVGGPETDKLTVTGAAAIDGSIVVSLLSGYTPTLGDSFDLLDFASFTGSPAWQLASLGAGLAWDTSSFATNGVISIIAAEAVPEPTTLASVFTGLTGLGLAYTWRKRK